MAHSEVKGLDYSDRAIYIDLGLVKRATAAGKGPGLGMAGST